MFRSSSGRTVARRLMIGALVLVIPVLAGCEAGLNAPTLQFHAASGGAYTTFNGIAINDVFVLGAPSGSVPAGSSASMFLALFNNGTSADKLVSVTAPGAATNVELTGGGINVPASSSVNLTGPSPSIVLSNLTKPLPSGGSIPVTLDFQHAGAVIIQVPVQPRAFEYSTFSPPPPSPTASPSTQPAKAVPSKSPLGKATPSPSATR
ncbi:MAG TPA: copper chaperone PCu(A)C [Trebonia sp.]